MIVLWNPKIHFWQNIQMFLILSKDIDKCNKMEYNNSKLNHFWFTYFSCLLSFVLHILIILVWESLWGFHFFALRLSKKSNVINFWGKRGLEKNRQGFSPNLDHSLKIEVEHSSARFLFLAAWRQKRRQLVEKPQFSRVFDKLWESLWDSIFCLFYNSPSIRRRWFDFFVKAMVISAKIWYTILDC